jgi:NADH-quinone oxidoreductase subunit L
MMDYYILIPLLPLVGFVVNILMGKRFGEQAHWIPLLAAASSLILSIAALYGVMQGRIIDEDIYTWITAGDFKVSIGFQIDQVTAVMLIVVTAVSFLVHVYSIGYMHGDTGYYRFFSYLGLFTFSMLMLVMSNNFLQLYFGWEAVGLCSYFLIGYYFNKKSAADAARKAFVVNRFGDFGFGLGIIVIFLTFGSLHYADVFSRAPEMAQRTVNFLGRDVNLMTLIALLLFCGAVGKSAQIPLHVWLPDAMEGPTPVSALIHAATMVTAGVFMVARTSPIFNLSPFALGVVTVTGGLTAIFAATIALVQNDIKRVVAYSTVSQLGYMFVACGVGAYGAGMFHLFTHAFFKALLFLCAGSVMHAMGGELNIQKMGGLKKYMPYTYRTMLLGSLSIAGFPLVTAGFFSKDEILWRAFSSGTAAGRFAWLAASIAALLTAIYSFRVIFLTFHGKFRGTHEQEHHLHESPASMTAPLMALAVGAIAAGWIGIPHILGGHDRFIEFTSPVLGHAHQDAGGRLAEIFIMLVSSALGLAGIGIAYYMYVKNTELPGRLASAFAPVYKVLFNKYYVDELYDMAIIRPVMSFSDAVINRFADRAVIDAAVNGAPALIGRLGRFVRRVQTGVVMHYTIIMAAGLFVLAALILTQVWQ